jgi:hypothetical protein
MRHDLPSPRLPRHRGVTLVAGQEEAALQHVADTLARPDSHRLAPGPDVHDAADEVHRAVLDLARSGEPVDVTVRLRPGTPTRSTALLLGSLLDHDLGRPDGASLLQHVACVVSADDLADLVLRGTDDRFAAAEHVIELVEHATLVVLTDVGAVTEREHRLLAALLGVLAPTATVLPITSLTAGCLPTPGRASALAGSAGWMRALSDDAPDVVEGDPVSTVVYRDERPFHPERLAVALEQTFTPGPAGTVLRSRGFTQFATRADRVGSWSSVGQMLSLDPTSRPSWHPESPHGQQIAFFGLDLDAGLVRRALDECLLTDAELLADPASWRDLVDPFPTWDDATGRPGHDHRH